MATPTDHLSCDLQLLHPLEARVYRECAASMGRIGRDCIEKRIKALTLPPGTDTSVDMETLVDDFVTFYVAGQETTANALSFAVILIHQHPEVLDKLLSEIEDVLGDRKEVTGDDLDKLKYTEQVIQEVLRMYPTVIRMIKESPRGGLELSGYHIPEFFTAVMSRNPAFFNDPDTFDPSRFDVDKPRPGPFVYFPFSVGHRSCIGHHFAMIGLKITLTRLLKTFRVTLPPSFSLVVEQRITLLPQGGVPCTLREIS
ncbi:hypothetical protein EMCRGX_G029309 [Ephydatia muelleri]